jgi:hypothetical protein
MVRFCQNEPNFELAQAHRKPAVKLNERVSLRHHLHRLSIAAPDRLRKTSSTRQSRRAIIFKSINLFDQRIATVSHVISSNAPRGPKSQTPGPRTESGDLAGQFLELKRFPEKVCEFERQMTGEFRRPRGARTDFAGRRK